MQPDGKVLRGDFDALQRFEPGGTLDPTFGSPWGSGRRSDLVPFTIEAILLLLPSGDIVVAGMRKRSVAGAEEPETVFDQLALARYDEDGHLDPGFGVGGVVLLGDDLGVHAERLIGLAPRPGGGVTLLAADKGRPQWGEAVAHSGTTLVGTTSAGTLDPAFGDEGVAHLAGLVAAFHPLAGGGLLLAGDAWGSPVVAGRTSVTSDFFLARYGDDGRPDQSFGTAGYAIADFGGVDLARAMLVEPGGSVVLGGGSTDTSNSLCLRVSRFCDEAPVLARFTSNGALDPTFGSGGLLRLEALAAAYSSREDNVGVMALASLPGERIVAGGGSGSAAFLAELSSTGTLEPGFGEAGIVTERDPRASGARVRALGVDGRGRLLLAGMTDSGVTGRGREAAVFRYLPGGVLDTSYGDGLGYVRVPAAAHLAVARDGSVTISNGRAPVWLTRIAPDGKLDSNFGEDGLATLPRPPYGARIASIALLPDGGVVAAGTTYKRSRIAVFRTHADGSPDPSFGRDGYAEYAFGHGHRGRVTQMTLDRHGRVLIVGSVDSGRHETMAAIRIRPNGKLDRRFGNRGVVRMPFGRRGRASAVAVQDNGEILVAGRAWHRSVLSDLLLRLRANGRIDRRFGTRGVSWARAARPVNGPQGPGTILRLRRRILALRRGHAGQVLVYRPDGRLRGSLAVPREPKPKGLVQRPVGAIQGGRAVLAAQLRYSPAGSFGLWRLRLR